MNVLTHAHMWPQYFLVGNSCGMKGEFLQKLGQGDRLWRLQVPACTATNYRFQAPPRPLETAGPRMQRSL